MTSTASKVSAVSKVATRTNSGMASGGTTPAIMPSQLAFVQEFITGMTPGMSTGANVVRIGHGRWGTTNATVQAMTNVAATAITSLGLPVNAAGGTTNYPGNQGGTNYNQAVAQANTLLTGSTADKRIVLFITDATVDATQLFPNPNDFT